AEDGIRDLIVTGVQTCALPILFRYLTESAAWARWQGETAEIDPRPGGRFRMTLSQGPVAEGEFVEVVQDARVVFTWGWVGNPIEIGRASCRERVESGVVDGWRE